MVFDLFNGDADGIFALHQYRLSFPACSRLITGVKRDIKLLDKIDAGVQGAEIQVFDISLDSNRSRLAALLADGNRICWFDHHFAGEIPNHPNLSATIETSASTCTSLIVNHHLKGAHPLWALCGAFGDNLHAPAKELARRHHLKEREVARLRELGELVNYNSYGADPGDLHFAPADLYRAVSSFTSPFAWLDQSEELAVLRCGCADDLRRAEEEGKRETAGSGHLYFFPDAPWARRISGLFSNREGQRYPDIAQAVITSFGDSVRISVRAPLTDRRDADILCRRFPTGGGRAAAAGINALPAAELPRFIDAFGRTWA